VNKVNNATVVGPDKVLTDDGQEHSGPIIAQEISTLGLENDDRVEWSETEYPEGGIGPRLVVNGD
jgi:hypothetical protein